MIAGHSWGTVIGSIYVQRYPENVSCYIGISQITNLYENKLNAARTALEKDEIKGTGDEQNLTELIKRMSQVKNYDDMRWFLLQMDTEKFFALNKEIMEYAFFGFAIDMLSKTYKVPVYYLAGKGDYAVCQKDAQAYYESIEAPDKAFYWIENAGHSMFMDNPKLYSDTIKNVLSKIDD